MNTHTHTHTHTQTYIYIYRNIGTPQYKSETNESFPQNKKSARSTSFLYTITTHNTQKTQTFNGIGTDHITIVTRLTITITSQV